MAAKGPFQARSFRGTWRTSWPLHRLMPSLEGSNYDCCGKNADPSGQSKTQPLSYHDRAPDQCPSSYFLQIASLLRPGGMMLLRTVVLNNTGS